ncbi:YraN family protein [Demequina sp. NBRC 110053]|uniref:YraN family protein n=1 Tax=Demequina sp. NBRC 110053 TaxID=1570342 RepID=UPI0009FDCFC2|nr:YraN family protein [Demequina sp. NBRC 110053]
MDARRQVGRHGEDVVARRLAELGWEVLDRNWRCARGELDIVARDGGCAVAVEVKTRRTGACGSGLEAVTPAKVARLRRLLAAWLDTRDERFEEVRIDAVAVTLPRAGAAQLDHVRGIG